MAALLCEFCGGKLKTKAGGICECDSCGMEYDKDWVKEKIQEIKGTVKVEGTVEVTGTVKVEGGVSKESLLKRAMMCCADEDWEKAEDLLEQVLNIDPECAEGYVGKLMVSWEVRTRKDLALCEDSFEDDSDFLKAMQFGNRTLKGELDGYLKQVCERIRKEQEETEKREAQQKQDCNTKLAAVRARIAPVAQMIAAGAGYTVGLRMDSSVAAVGSNEFGKCEIKGWIDIDAVAACQHTVGLRTDGRVVAAGSNKQGQCDVSGWENIVAVSVGRYHTVGLKADGTVVAVGTNDQGQCNVSGWTDIAAIAAGYAHTVGLRADGTVVATGWNNAHQCDVGSWTGMVAIAAGEDHTVGLDADGRVRAVGNGWQGACKVGPWRDIVAVSAGFHRTAGLKADGTVVVTGSDWDVEHWSDIVAVSAGSLHMVGLKSDGTLMSVGKIEEDMRDISRWKLFHGLETLKQDRETAHSQAVRRHQEKIDGLRSEKDRLTAELSNLKGLFSGRRRKELESRIAEIDGELKNLGG